MNSFYRDAAYSQSNRGRLLSMSLRSPLLKSLWEVEQEVSGEKGNNTARKIKLGRAATRSHQNILLLVQNVELLVLFQKFLCRIQI